LAADHASAYLTLAPGENEHRFVMMARRAAS
jgi:hypothetical protein